MRKFVVCVMLALSFAVAMPVCAKSSGSSKSVEQSVKKAGKDTDKAVKKSAKKTEKGLKKADKKISESAKKSSKKIKKAFN